MLDPIRNAKTIGYLFLIFALIDGISLLGSLNNIGAAPTFILTVNLIVSLVVAFGLIKTKLWAVYGIGGLIAMRVVAIFYNYSLQIPPSVGTLIMLAIFVLLFIWLFSAKERFSK